MKDKKLEANLSLVVSRIFARSVNDVSSTLSPKNRSYFYPSVSGSLIFSNLFEHKEWFTFGKLRASWAKVGGDTSPYQLQLEYGLKPYTNKGTSLGYITSGSVPNANLKTPSSHLPSSSRYGCAFPG